MFRGLSNKGSLRTKRWEEDPLKIVGMNFALLALEILLFSKTLECLNTFGNKI